MAGFLYFRSGDARPIKRDGVDKLGLGYAFTGSIEGRPTNSTSPSGKPGLVFADAARQGGKTLGYFPSEQTWRKLPKVEGRPELWVGYWNDAKPGPGDLERKPMLPGEVAMTLGDGNQWVIPTLTEFDGETKSGDCVLPAPLDYDEDGNLFTGKPTGVYGQLWDVVHPVALGVCFGSDGPDVEFGEPSDSAVRAAAFALLSANYVVSMPELVVLGCLKNDTTFRTIVLASCRGEWLMEAIATITKKNEIPTPVDGSNTSDGKAA